MNLQSIVEILAGGRGSGCRGPNCGRHPTKTWDRKETAKVVAIDFDRTLEEHESGGVGVGGPLPHGLELLDALHKKGYTIHVFTARTDTKPVQDWLDSHGVGYAHATNNKPEAAAYVDDRAVHWTGNESVASGVQQIEDMSKIYMQQHNAGLRSRTTGIHAAILLYGGGVGSGCNPAVGKCGRHPGEGTWKAGDGDVKKFYLDENGHYTPERVAYHDKEVMKYQNKPEQKNPVMTLLLGGSASGKSTYDLKESAKLRSPTIIDIDKMRSDAPEFGGIAGTPETEQFLDEARDIRDQTFMSAVAHNNDIALESTGHPDTPEKLDAMEKAGYKLNIVYIHRPVDESITLANKRAESSKTLSGRITPPVSAVRFNHAATRTVLPKYVKPGREITVYDGTGHWDPTKGYDVIYHRKADGTVDAKDDAKLERFRNAEEPKIPDVFK